MASKKRRIYTELKEILDPDHTALVVWDVQNGLVGRIFNQEEFLKNLKGLIKAARESNIPVVYSKITPLPKEFESPPRTLMMMRRFGIDDPDKVPTFMPPGSPESEIHTEVQPLEGEAVIPKHTASFFIGTHFENMMRNRGIETILFTGIATEMGVASSARDSINRGFYTAVVSDCVSSMDKEMHESALKILGRICIVVSSEELMGIWK
ncbi:MAG: cysteine hydrolase [Deltaproteobacteria bacterium]|nr:cysteine hydrolase [Deltaproteobacteria bacterium]MBW2086858.1 cysteine hydrolase [Deltaproteobacteria bacterium]